MKKNVRYNPFANPLQEQDKLDKKRVTERERARKRVKKKGNLDNRRNFHEKHG
jgi:hypothetical protein